MKPLEKPFIKLYMMSHKIRNGVIAYRKDLRRKKSKQKLDRLYEDKDVSDINIF